MDIIMGPAFSFTNYDSKFDSGVPQKDQRLGLNFIMTEKQL